MGARVIKVIKAHKPLVVNGCKKHSIVKGNKHSAGEGLYLICTNGVRLRHTQVEKTQDIFVDAHVVHLDGLILSTGEANTLAVDEGFKDFGELVHFLRYKKTFPLQGQLVWWL